MSTERHVGPEIDTSGDVGGITVSYRLFGMFPLMGDDAWIGGLGGDGCPPGPGRGGFVVVMADPVTGEVDAFGPYAGPVAASEVDRRRHELAMEGLEDVLVVAVALSPPEPSRRELSPPEPSRPE